MITTHSLYLNWTFNKWWCKWIKKWKWKLIEWWWRWRENEKKAYQFMCIEEMKKNALRIVFPNLKKQENNKKYKEYIESVMWWYDDNEKRWKKSVFVGFVGNWKEKKKKIFLNWKEDEFCLFSVVKNDEKLCQDWFGGKFMQLLWRIMMAQNN